WRREAVPDFLDAVELNAAPFGERGLREPRRDADPHRAGHQLEQRPAAGCVEPVEPWREMRTDIRAACALQGLHDLAQRRNVICPHPLASLASLPRRQGRV